MFARTGRTLAKIASLSSSGMTLALQQLMRTYGVRSFRDGFQKRQFEARTREPATRYTRRYHTNSKRECQRRRIADADQQQRDSHKPGTVQPRHIFGPADG